MPAVPGRRPVLSEDSALIEVERRIRAAAAASALPGVRVKVHPRIADRLAAPGAAGGAAPDAELSGAPGVSLLGLIESGDRGAGLRGEGRRTRVS